MHVLNVQLDGRLCIYLCNYHSNQDIEQFHHSKKFPHALSQNVYPTPTHTTGNHHLCCHHILRVAFLELHINVTLM